MSRFREWPWQKELSERYPHYYDLNQYRGVNLVDAQGRTRLMRAAERGDILAVKRLLFTGANPHLEAIYPGASGTIRYAGTNALIEAISSESTEAVRLLLHSGVNPNRCVLYTDTGMGTYTRLPNDVLTQGNVALKELLVSHGMNADRYGELFRMRTASPKAAVATPV